MTFDEQYPFLELEYREPLTQAFTQYINRQDFFNRLIEEYRLNFSQVIAEKSFQDNSGFNIPYKPNWYNMDKQDVDNNLWPRTLYKTYALGNEIAYVPQDFSDAMKKYFLDVTFENWIVNVFLVYQNRFAYYIITVDFTGLHKKLFFRMGVDPIGYQIIGLENESILTIIKNNMPIKFNQFFIDNNNKQTHAVDLIRANQNYKHRFINIISDDKRNQERFEIEQRQRINLRLSESKTVMNNYINDEANQLENEINDNYRNLDILKFQTFGIMASKN